MPLETIRAPFIFEDGTEGEADVKGFRFTLAVVRSVAESEATGAPMVEYVTRFAQVDHKGVPSALTHFASGRRLQTLAGSHARSENGVIRVAEEAAHRLVARLGGQSFVTKLARLAEAEPRNEP